MERGASIRKPTESLSLIELRTLRRAKMEMCDRGSQIDSRLTQRRLLMMARTHKPGVFLTAGTHSSFREMQICPSGISCFRFCCARHRRFNQPQPLPLVPSNPKSHTAPPCRFLSPLKKRPASRQSYDGLHSNHTATDTYSSSDSLVRLVVSGASRLTSSFTSGIAL